MMAAIRQHHQGEFSPEQSAMKARSCGRFIAAEMVGYYGLLGAAAIGALLLH